MKNSLNFLILFLFIVANLNAQSTASKQVSTFRIEAPQLNTYKTIWVYTPKTYSSTITAYPVIYMLDAQNLFDAETSYVGEWEIDEYMDSLNTNESIIIGIEHGNEKRIEELTPYSHEKYGGGQGDAFMQFIINTVKPHVDITYRTKPESEHTTIFGSSLGGLMAFYATLKYPNIFSNGIAFSSAFWINPEIYDLTAATDVPKTSRFYFLAGANESETMVPNQEKMVDLLVKKGINENNIESKIIEGGEHNEAFWSLQFAAAYQWLITKN